MNTKRTSDLLWWQPINDYRGPKPLEHERVWYDRLNRRFKDRAAAKSTTSPWDNLTVEQAARLLGVSSSELAEWQQATDKELDIIDDAYDETARDQEGI